MFCRVSAQLGRLVRTPLASVQLKKPPLRWVSSTGGGPGDQKLKVAVNGAELHYVRAGVGTRPILCIPGALGTAVGDYSKQLEFFGAGEDEGTGTQFTIVAFDPRGYGSSRPPTREFQIKPVHFLKQDGLDGHALMHKLGFEKFSVFGWSDGGVAAMFLAAAFPRSVEKLVIWGGNAFVKQDDLDMFEATRDINTWGRKKLEQMTAVYGSELAPMWSRWMDSFVALLESGGDLCMEGVKTIQCPTLILHGGKDPMVPDYHPTYLRENIPGAHFYEFPQGGHAIHYSYADTFNRKVRDFLNVAV